MHHWKEKYRKRSKSLHKDSGGSGWSLIGLLASLSVLRHPNSWVATNQAAGREFIGKVVGGGVGADQRLQP